MGDARAGLMALGALLVLASAVPYLLTIASGRTRPRIFSWIVWTLLGAVATAAACAEGAYASAALTAAATLETGSIVVLGWRCGNRDVERLDAYCLAGAVAGLGLWAVLDSPLTGLAVALAIDAVAAVPTVRHAWRRPHEEAAAAYALCAVAALCVLAAVPEHSVVGLLYPVYSLAVNALIAGLVLCTARPRTWSGSGSGHRAPSSGRHAAPGPAVPARWTTAALGSGRHAAPPSGGAVRLPAPRTAPDGQRAGPPLGA